MRSRTIIAAVAAPLAIGGALLASTGAASAATLPVHSAVGAVELGGSAEVTAQVHGGASPDWQHGVTGGGLADYPVESGSISVG